MKMFRWERPGREGLIAVAATVASALLVLFLILLAFRGCSERRAIEARAAGAEREAATASGKDAVNTTAAATQREAEADALTLETETAIRKTEGANEIISPGLDAAARARLCLRHAYRCQPQCVSLLGACPK